MREEAQGQRSTAVAPETKPSLQLLLSKSWLHEAPREASCQGASDLQTCQDLLTGGSTIWGPAKSLLCNSCKPGLVSDNKPSTLDLRRAMCCVDRNLPSGLRRQAT